MGSVNRGIWLVLIFLLSQAIRDVYLAGTFQSYNVSQILAPLFFVSSLIFAAKAIVGRTEQIGLLRANTRTILSVNLATVGAWLSYFFALKWLEPALVNSFHEGVIPLAVAGSVVLARGPNPQGRATFAVYSAMVLVLVYFAAVILYGKSGFTRQEPLESWPGVLLAIVSGVFITWGILASKRLNDRGLTAESVMALRFVAVTLIAGTMAYLQRATQIPWSEALPTLGLSFLLVIAPLYLFQKAIDLASPITIGVVTSLGPILIFAIQMVEGRIDFSLWSLSGIAAYSVLAITANLQQGWRSRA